QTELSARYGLRSALLMAMIMPAMTLMWDLIWAFEPSAGRSDPGPVVRALSSVIDTSSIATAVCCGLAVVVLATGLRVPPAWTLRSLGLAVVLGISLTAAASLGMHLVGAPGHAAVMPQVVAASIVSAVLATWLIVRALRCWRLAR
ncbi:MAG: hypothetical protein ACRDQB_17665, partial [Thermocrispum sp.]